MFDNHVVIKSDGTPQHTQVIVNDQDISRFLNRLSILGEGGSLFRVDGEMMAGPSLDITVVASVNILIQTLPSYELHEETLENGSKRYWTVPSGAHYMVNVEDRE